MHFRNIIHYGNYIQPYHFQSFKDIPRSKTYLGQNYQHIQSAMLGSFFHLMWVLLPLKYGRMLSARKNKQTNEQKPFNLIILEEKEY